MYCQNCGKLLPDGVKFCTGCGAKQPTVAGTAPAPAAQSYAPPAQPAVEPAPVSHVRPPEPVPRRREPRERVFLGLLGALLGSLAGVALQIILAQMGYVAALSGVVMAVCTLLGYQHFGRRLSGLGIFLSILVMIVMVMVGMALSAGFMVLLQMGGDMEDFVSVVTHYIPNRIQILTGGYQVAEDVKEEIIEGILMQYGFVALGAVPTIIGSIKNRSK